MKDLILKNNAILLCRGKGCCPKVTKSKEGKVLITDDDGNKVVLTEEQALMLPEAVSLLSKEENA